MKAAVIIIALGACSGSIDTGASGSEGESKFASTVAPLLRENCAGCHEGAGAGPAFLGEAGGDDDYLQLLSNSRVVGNFQSSTALILTKGSHSGSTWWDAGQQAKIASWLDAELADFGDNGIPDVLAEWVGCMTIENWNDSRMGEWANKRTDQDATCGGCHSDGEYGFHANATNDTMFIQQRTALGIGSFFQVSAAGETPEVFPTTAKLRSKCSGANLHPGCAVDDEYVEYLDRFYKLTRATLTAGLCAPAGYKTLTDPI